MRIFGSSSRRRSVIEMDMSIPLFNGLLLLSCVVGYVTMSEMMIFGKPGTMSPPVKKCVYRKHNNVLEAWCSSLELPTLPNLKTDIQVLDATVNRIRELTNQSLAPYKNLLYIYLGDNFIQNIGEGVFANQYYLEVLDLSTNGCDSVPKSLFQLPYLRTLYFASNKFTDSVFEVEVSSPLRMLQLAQNKLTKIPSMGLLPTLKHLNLSDNSITKVSTEDLAPFCSLQILDLSKNPINFNGCECHTLNAWLKERKVNVTSDFANCKANNDCINVKFSNRTYELYNNCSAIIQQKRNIEKARSVWILVVSVASAFLFMVFVALFCVHKRNRRRHRKQKEQQQLAANNANTELLNSNLTAGNS